MSRLFDDANNEYAEIDSAVVATYPLTMAAWFYTDSIALRQTILAIADKDVADHFHQLIAHGLAAGDPVRYQCQGGGAVVIASTTTGFSANTWHHACAIGRNATDRSVFIDGGSEGTNAQDKTPANLDRTSIGRTGDSTPTFYMSGRIAEAAVWNVDLTDDEVVSLAGGVSPLRVRPESLVAYWPLYGVGSPEPDYIGTYDLTLFSGDSGPVVADHAPVQPPFGFDPGPVGIYTTEVPVVRIPRHPAAYNALAIY
jgi:hypothetical protein